MAYSHRDGDSRACGASTTVTGQDFVIVEGALWAVNGDPNNHGQGDLITSNGWLRISGLGIIVAGNSAQADDLCPIIGGPHCAPSATGFSSLVNVV
jgi:hypothetical protein